MFMLFIGPIIGVSVAIIATVVIISSISGLLDGESDLDN
jgi:hypothetical protein